MTTGNQNFDGVGRLTTREARRSLHAEAVSIIGREYADNLRLPEVARRIGASERALQRAFAEHGKLSFSDALRSRRLEVAARLLCGTDMPVGEIARRVGYGDHAPFTKAFRRQYGMSPRSYAARARHFGCNGAGDVLAKAS